MLNSAASGALQWVEPALLTANADANAALHEGGPVTLLRF